MESRQTRHTVASLQDELARRSGRRVMLCLTDNRSRMVSAKTLSAGLVELRLQRMFLDAPHQVVVELADMLTGRERSRPALRDFIDSRVRTEPPGEPRVRDVSPDRSLSDHHDIVSYARELNRIYLGGRSTARVVWGRRNRVRSRRSIRFGCYDPSRNIIIMNRKLDSAGIPGYYVQYILFHEMLHEVLGIGQRADGKRDIHGSLFRLMERSYPDFDKALRFEKELCKRLGSL